MYEPLKSDKSRVRGEMPPRKTTLVGVACESAVELPRDRLSSPAA
jgi:hypothetical protein